MKLFKEKTWQFETSGVEGEVKLFGVNIFDYQWQETGEYVKVTDPLYHTERSFCLYKVVINGDKNLAYVVAGDDEKHDRAKQAKYHGK